MSEREGYAVPAARHRVEQTIERSRFIATLAPAPDADSARAFIDEMRAEFPDATHNCWAFAAGPPGDTAVIGMSDDGEPHGTAGRPMLEVLLHTSVGEVAAVVTRYYGGTKLGKGGLARAYGGSVQRALESLPTTMRLRLCTRFVILDYADVDAVRRTLEQHGAELVEETYGENVRYRIATAENGVERLATDLLNATAGRARLLEEATAS